MSNLLGALDFAADVELQRAVWIDKVPGLTSVISIGEFFCQFFDDNDMDGFITNQMATSPLDECEQRAIVNFRDALIIVEQLPSYRLDDDVQTLDTPEWRSLVDCAHLTRTTLCSRRGSIESAAISAAEPVVPADGLRPPLN